MKDGRPAYIAAEQNQVVVDGTLKHVLRITGGNYWVLQGPQDYEIRVKLTDTSKRAYYPGDHVQITGYFVGPTSSGEYVLISEEVEKG